MNTITFVAQALKTKIKNNYGVVGLCITIAIYLIYISLVSNFSQNDDWVYRLNVQYFLDGNFVLHWYLGPTIILQLFLGYLWSLLFGIETLDTLTAIVSSINVFIFAYILKKYVTRKLWVATTAIILFTFNPINMYTTIGFMTGQYFMFFLLLMMICFYKIGHHVTNAPKIKFFTFNFLPQNQTCNPLNVWLNRAVIVSALGLLVRQVTLVFPLGFSFYYGIKMLEELYKTRKFNDLAAKYFKLTFFGGVWFLALFVYLKKFFPQTQRMLEVPLQYHHLTNFDYSFAMIYGILIVVCAFVLPFVFKIIFNFVAQLVENKKFLWLGLYFILAGAIYFTANYYFKPMTISWGEFPYFENTFERTGFYPRGIHGTKYQLMFNYDIYYYWDLAAKIFVSLFMAFLAIVKFGQNTAPGKKDPASKLKPLFTIEAALIICYITVLIITETFYDRYILPLVPITILYLIKNQYFNLKLKAKTLKKPFNFTTAATTFGFAFFITFYTYQFTWDFVKINNYVWNRSQQLIASDAVPAEQIHGTNAWKLRYRNPGIDYIYFFSYDSQQVNNDLNELYEFIEEKEINYWLNGFIESKVYLYKYSIN